MADSMTRRGNPNMVKGAPSVNHRGRPKKGLAISDVLTSKMSTEVWAERVLAALDHEKTGIREQVELLKLWASYAYGRPASTVDLTVNRGEDATLPAEWHTWSMHQKSKWLDHLDAPALDVIDIETEDE